jgi:hypothetical protein
VVFDGVEGGCGGSHDHTGGFSRNVAIGEPEGVQGEGLSTSLIKASAWLLSAGSEQTRCAFALPSWITADREIG